MVGGATIPTAQKQEETSTANRAIGINGRNSEFGILGSGEELRKSEIPEVDSERRNAARRGFQDVDRGSERSERPNSEYDRMNTTSEDTWRRNGWSCSAKNRMEKAKFDGKAPGARKILQAKYVRFKDVDSENADIDECYNGTRKWMVWGLR